MTEVIKPSRPGARSRGAARWLGRAGLFAAVAGLGMAAVGVGMLVNSASQEQQLTDHWRQAVVEAKAAGGASQAPAGALDRHPSRPLSPALLAQLRKSLDGAEFAIRVPKIRYFAAVREGVGLGILYIGPGHYPGTAMPGDPGNVGVAAHNTYWIEFGSLRPGDIVQLETLTNTYTYRITGTRIVSPSDVAVLSQTDGPRLTLTTCWPLWAGALAQQRLVIFGQQVKAA